MALQHPGLAEVVRRDPRYAYDAYEFVFAALHHTQKLLGKVPKEPAEAESPDYHVSGPQLLDGIRDLALKQFGLMARPVFHAWGIHKTDDFGEIVFNLVEAKLMGKTEEDTRADFQNVFDLDAALTGQYEIKLNELE